MERFFDVCEATLDLGHDLDEIVYIEASARRAGDDGDAAFAQFERF